MKHQKLNLNWNADPIAPTPVVSTIEDGIELSFYLNSEAFEHIDSGEKAKLTFYNVYAYRLASMTQEDYLSGQFRFKSKQLPWGQYYELKASKWEKDLPDDRIIRDESIDKSELKHFIFFMKDQTFECIAADYRFAIENNVEDLLDEKYPKGYLNYYLSMFASQFDKPTIDNFKVYTNLYLQMANKKEFESLKAELKNIKKNKDLPLYLKYANSMGIADFGTKQLNDMVKVIETYKI